MNPAALAVGVLVIALLALRSKLNVPPWLTMLIGGALMVALGVITPSQALASVDLNVILFLLSLFIFASALEVSGFFEYVAYRISMKYKDPKRIMFASFLTSALLSSVASNDAIAASFTPILLNVAKLIKVDERPSLYAVAFGVTIGSVMTPIGNPQNVLIALSGMPNPFYTFFIYLALPTALNLVLIPYLMSWEFRELLKVRGELDLNSLSDPGLKDEYLAKLSLAILALTIALGAYASATGYDMVLVFLIGAVVLLTLTRKREAVILGVDYPTLLLFVGLFMFVEGLKEGGVVQFIIEYLPGLSTVFGVMVVSIVLSQVLSNVPLVALLLPYVSNQPNSVNLLVALAAGSTIAGNFTLLGAASNLIVTRASEIRGGKKLEYFEFMKYATPVLIVNFVTYYAFISLVGRAL
ncbi:MAG: SLC13 family permease [Sulfolobaceae archaeon]|nr:SLC13 family permease [Sulfolobales archaeon]